MAWRASSGRCVLSFTCILTSILLIGLGTAPARAQVRGGGYLGAYGVGQGAHPFVHLAVGGRVGTPVVGPLSLELEALHVAASVWSRPVDLFGYRGNVMLHSGTKDVRPFVIIGAGYHEWRTWVCEATSCGDPPGRGRRFAYDKGLGYTLGGGARFHASGPVWFRVDARFEKERFNAPSDDDWLATLGAEFQPR